MLFLFSKIKTTDKELEKMEKLTVVVNAEAGIHARPASSLVKKAGEFKATIKLEKEDKVVDAKRLLAVLSLGAKKGDTLVIAAEGEDEVEAAKAIKELIESEI